VVGHRGEGDQIDRETLDQIKSRLRDEESNRARIEATVFVHPAEERSAVSRADRDEIRCRGSVVEALPTQWLARSIFCRGH